MIRTILMWVAVALVIGYIASNPHGAAGTVKHIAFGIGDFLTSLVG